MSIYQHDSGRAVKKTSNGILEEGDLDMAYHNPTCGCAECGNYGLIYNPTAIHNQSCGCAQCGNYPSTSRYTVESAFPTPSEVPLLVPTDLADEIRAFIAQRKAEIATDNRKTS